MKELRDSKPPCTGSTVARHKNEITVKMSVDTSDIDRVSIGMRLYDMLNMGNVNNKVQNDDGNLYITEKDINEMFRLVNNNCKAHLIVYRSDE